VDFAILITRIFRQKLYSKGRKKSSDINKGKTFLGLANLKLELVRVVALPGNIVHLFNMMPFLELRFFFILTQTQSFAENPFYMIHMKASAS